MTVTKDDFDKIWASQSPLTPYSFSESQYKEGWNFVGGTPPSRQMWDAFMQGADEKLKYLYQHEDVPVGFEYFTMNPNIPQGSLPLLGGEYSRETYADLWSWVQEQTGYLKTEAEWQALSTSNNGNVPFYSDGDGSTTFRVPSLHCWIKGSDGSAQLVGSYLEAGLPNITGDRLNGWGDAGAYVGVVIMQGGDTRQSGALYASHNKDISGALYFSNASPVVADWHNQTISFDASRSNPIYGNANTVQPESIVGMWLVKAYGVIVDTGTIDEQAYIDDRFNASKQYTQDYFAGQMLYKGNILLATTSVNSATTLNVNCSGYRFVILRLAGNDTNMQDFLIPVGSDFNFAHKIFGADNGTVTVNIKGHFDTVNGQLVIPKVLFNGWTEVYVTVIGAI